MKKQICRLLIAAACCAVSSAGRVHAQETIHAASVNGRVTDSQGAVVPGAHVSARQTATNATAERVFTASIRMVLVE